MGTLATKSENDCGKIMKNAGKINLSKNMNVNGCISNEVFSYESDIL